MKMFLWYIKWKPNIIKQKLAFGPNHNFIYLFTYYTGALPLKPHLQPPIIVLKKYNDWKDT
jgi:hypothetical protein